ncbi:AAA family ATPase [Pseudomonas sp. NY15435]|uniref:AAA family ATPase n=1 Tax=Pseudomonas sp. NY15435 TaxID=3400358 RepID=UPI003A8ADCD6
MLNFNRNSEPPPRALQNEEFRAHRRDLLNFFQFEDAKRAQSRAPSKLNLDHESINKALSRLFHGKCAFCESKTHTKPYRFRPTSNANPSKRKTGDHLYYTWLSHAWENIYPICTECYPLASDYFPVKNKRSPLPTESQLRDYEREDLGLWRVAPKERPLLLDPCNTINFVPHFTVDIYGSIFPQTEEAKTTVTHFNLDRDELTERRRRTFEKYFSELYRAIDRRNHINPNELTWLFDFEELEFGGLWYLTCREIFFILTNNNAHKASLTKNKILGAFYKFSHSGAELISEDELSSLLNDRIIRLPRNNSYMTREVTGDPPTLTSLEIINFKGIEQLRLEIPEPQSLVGQEFETIQPALLILGENAAGKSSILEAVALALTVDEARQELDLNSSDFLLNPELIGASNEPIAAAATVDLTFDFDLKHTLTITNRGYIIEGQSALPPVFAYGAFRQYRKIARKNSLSRPIESLFRSDRLLSNPERWLLSLSDYDFDSVVRVLREILSIEGEFDVIERDFQNKRCLIVTGISNDLPNRTPLSLASSGYRSMLAMVCDILYGLLSPRNPVVFDNLDSAQAVVLIDEIEAHLHPRWKIQIMSALRRALPKVTFIATTHDPLCLRGMREGEVVVMHRVPRQQGMETRWPTAVEKMRDLPNVSHLTIEQLLTSDFFNLATTEQPSIEREFAQFADLLAAKNSGALTKPQQEAWLRFERDVKDSLPIGDTEVQQLVQEAVAEFLARRRQSSAENLLKLRQESKQRIINILEAL